MSENSYNNPLIPATPPPKPVSEEQLAINFLEAMRIHAADRYEKPTFALYRKGVGFAPLGNIMAICAEAKNGKSWLMKQFAIAILKGEFCGLTSDLENRRTMYFDTEQDHYDVKLIQNQVHYVCGWAFEKDNDQFLIYAMDVFDKLKKDATVQENRLMAIRAGIEYYKPSVIFVDGVRDLIEDFNDLGQSARLVQELMTIARKNNCLIVTVLHVNPNSDKMRGHLGTEMQNKTTDVMTVKKEDQGGIKVFKVHQVAARHMDIDDWTFWINDKGTFPIPELIDEAEVISSTPIPPKQDDTRQYVVWIGAETVSYTKLREGIKKDFGMGSGKANTIILQAVQQGHLEQLPDNKFRLRLNNEGEQASMDMGESTEAPF